MTYTNLQQLETKILRSLDNSLQFVIAQELHPQTLQKHQWLLNITRQYTAGVAQLLADYELQIAELEYRHQSLHSDTTKLVWLCSLFTNPNDVFEYPLAFFKYLHHAKQVGGFEYNPRTFKHQLSDIHFAWRVQLKEKQHPEAWAQLQKRYAA